MYQSVGHRAMPYIAEALSVPLIRENIRGMPLKTSLCYEEEHGADLEYNPLDEVEDLTRLLTKVKQVDFSFLCQVTSRS